MNLLPNISFGIDSNMDINYIYKAIDNALIESNRFYVYFISDKKNLFVGNRIGNTFHSKLIGGYMDGELTQKDNTVTLHVVIQSRCVSCATVLVTTILFNIFIIYYYQSNFDRWPSLNGIALTFIPSIICYFIIYVNLRQSANRIKKQFEEILKGQFGG